MHIYSQIFTHMPIHHDHDERMKFIDIFRSNATDVSRSCKAFQIDRRTFHRWMKEDDEFAQAIDDEREAMKDFGESQLLMLMRGIPKTDEATGKLIGWKERPDTACIIFFNKTKNKDRGYVERSEFVRKDLPVIDGFNYVMPDDANNNPADDTTNGQTT